MKKIQKKTRKKRKKKKNTGVLYSRFFKVLVICSAVAAVMFMIYVYTVLNSYDGLGIIKSVKQNPYELSLLERAGDTYNYDDGTYRSIRGIDVSFYQGDIDWKQVSEDGIDFAMIRLGYRTSDEAGRLRLDSEYRKNMREAGKAGIRRGVYFFSQAADTEEAIREAMYVMRHVDRDKLDFPVAFDMEPVNGSDRIKGLSRKERTEIADAFCKTLKKKGYPVMIYGNPNWLKFKLDRGYLTEYDVWLAHYTERPSYRRNFSMWQYTDSGKVKGIDGCVDMNIYFEKYN